MINEETKPNFFLINNENTYPCIYLYFLTKNECSNYYENNTTL